MITLLIVISHRRIVPHRLSLLGINLDVHVIRLGKLQKTYLMINHGYARNTLYRKNKKWLHFRYKLLFLLN